MTTGYLCERCGTRYGWFVGRGSIRRKREMDECVRGACDPKKRLVERLLAWAERRLTVV